MHSYLVNFGLLAILFIIVYGYKKILEYYELKRMGLHENERVYKAAEEFAHGVSSDDVKAILEDCFKIDDVDVEKILTKAIPHRTDKDGGYHAFIRSVNKEVGDDVYDERRQSHEQSAQHSLSEIIMDCHPPSGQNK
jgi:hypothetical protein